MRDRSGYSPQPAGSTSRKRALVSLVALAAIAAGCSHPQQSASAATTPSPLPASSAAAASAAPVAADRTTRPFLKATISQATHRPAVLIAAVAKKSHAVVTLPVAVPEIYSVSASPSVVHDGQSVVWDVRTTPDIVSVSATTTMISLPLTRMSPGHFGLTFSVPHGVPGFFHGTYNMDVTASTAGGTTLHRGIALTFL